MTNRASASVLSASPSSRSSAARPFVAAAASSSSTPGPPPPITTLPSSLLRYLPGPESLALAAARVSGKIKRKDRRVPMAGSGSSEGSAETRRWASSRSEHVGQV